jgi:hypothetical protein
MFNAQRLRKWLVEHKRSALWLSREARVGEATVYRLLGPRPHRPSTHVLAAISRVTHIPLDDLVCKEASA